MSDVSSSNASTEKDEDKIPNKTIDTSIKSFLNNLIVKFPS
ncbi:hypothetical protein [Clostridium sp. DSM 8431]|nr:hypothetical protein [Clostridium sp. DSM 8431]